MKASKYLLPAFFAANILLVSCSNNATNQDSTDTSSTTTGISDASSSKKTDTLSSSGTAVTKKVSVSSRCVGCGRCARLDSSHFRMNGHKAEAIQSSGNETALERAIDQCPVSAISAT